MAHAPQSKSSSTPAPSPAAPALVPGAGCLAGTWVLSLTGAPVRCVDPRAPEGRAPSPLDAAAAVDAVLDRLPPGRRPAQVVVGADVDPLDAGGEWDEAAFAAASRLVERGVALRLCTRGTPGEGGAGRAWDGLLRRGAHGAGAALEVRLFTLDAELAHLYEPSVPAPARRLAAAARLGAEGVVLEARIAPLLPWISDTAAHLEALVKALARVGIHRVRASYLHVDHRGSQRLRRLPKAHRALLRSCLAQAPAHPGEARLLPAVLRLQGHRRLGRLAAAAGLTATACHEANPDLAEARSCFEAPPIRRVSAAPAVSAPARVGAVVGAPGGATVTVAPPARATPPQRPRRRPVPSAHAGAQLGLFG